MNILIAGDFFVADKFQGKDLISKSILTLFEKADYRIVNQEAPITKDKPENKILKTGPHLRTSETTTIPFLKQLKIDMVTLANNHILDYGEEGLTNTFNVLKKEQIAFVGAGNNLKEAAKPFVLEKNGVGIAFLNFAENEWASATDDSAGANPMDIIDNAKQIHEARQDAGFVFVIVHGGHEYYNLPSPRMQKQYRFYAEQGADLVVGHHTHCISGNEVYKGVPIFYSLGNFLFTKNSTTKNWYTGLVLEVEIKKNKLIPKLHPIKQEEEHFRLELLQGGKKEVILNRIAFYNDIIIDKTKMNKSWEEYVNTKYNSYLNYWSPISFIRNRYIKALLNRLGIKLTNKNALTLFLNLMRCEAHADLSKEVTLKYLREK